MHNIWKKKMTEYHLRKKYNLKKNQKIINYNNHYFYKGVILQEIQDKKTSGLKCKTFHMEFVPYYYQIYL